MPISVAATLQPRSDHEGLDRRELVACSSGAEAQGRGGEGVAALVLLLVLVNLSVKSSPPKHLDIVLNFPGGNIKTL